MWHIAISFVIYSVSEECAASFISTEGSETEKVVGCVEKGNKNVSQRIGVANQKCEWKKEGRSDKGL
jgi:hypothetical protein